MELSFALLLPALALVAAISWGFWQLLRGIHYLIMKVLGAVGFVLMRVVGFLRSEAIELVQFASAGLSLGFLVPFTVGNALTGRWDRSRHYAKSIEDEFRSALSGAYRVLLAHPLRLVGLGGVLAGVEKRLPSIHEAAAKSEPMKMRNMAEAMEFAGYDVVGTLKAGGSGAQLYTAHPTPETVERFRKRGREISTDVVIKSFALVNGSTLPQIIRESRALEAASNLGLIYEHELDEDRFFYVMPLVHGETLDVIIERMHARSGAEGLNAKQLDLALGYARDLLRSLDRFHVGGLWHKDVKPANLIVSGERAHLVDFGLVTPLHSALTLTTHGTEYYRDPEMVRLAMQGVKVHEVDGVKFDLYSAGAVLFSMIENSFPAHGSLSQLTKKCPEALAWIVRRSMADIGSRYRGAWEMLDDLKTVAKARDPYLLRPADLPSMQRGSAGERPVRPDSQPNRFGLPKERARPVARAAAAPAPRVRHAAPPLGAAERPPKLPKSHGAPQRRSKPRGFQVFAALLLGMLSLGVLAALRNDQFQELEGRILESRSASAGTQDTQRGPEPQRLVHSSATQGQQEAYLAAQQLLDVVLPKRGRKGVDLGTLFAEAEPLLKGRSVYILQDFHDPASELVLANLRIKLREKGIKLAAYGEDQTRDSQLQFRSSGALDEALVDLQAYLESQEELGAVIWISAGEAPDTGLYELIIKGQDS